MAQDRLNERIFQALNGLDIELPSWGFADTGTRFGKFYQDAAAIDIYDKMRLAKCLAKAAFPLVTATGTAVNRSFWLHVAIHAIVTGLNWKSSDLHS